MGHQFVSRPLRKILTALEATPLSPYRPHAMPRRARRSSPIARAQAIRLQWRRHCNRDSNSCGRSAWSAQQGACRGIMVRSWTGGRSVMREWSLATDRAVCPSGLLHFPGRNARPTMRCAESRSVLTIVPEFLCCDPHGCAAHAGCRLLDWIRSSSHDDMVSKHVTSSPELTATIASATFQTCLNSISCATNVAHGT